MRYYLIDRVTELVVGQRAVGIKCVSLSDQVLHDHFPDYPTYPGALIIESASQLAGFLIEMTVNQQDQPLKRSLLAQIELAKFHERVQPGDTLRITTTLTKLRDSSAQVTMEAMVGDASAARARLLFMLQEVDSELIHQQRRYVYQLWTRELELPGKIL